MLLSTLGTVLVAALGFVLGRLVRSAGDYEAGFEAGCQHIETVADSRDAWRTKYECLHANVQEALGYLQPEEET